MATIHYSLDLKNKLIKYLKSTISVYRLLTDIVKIQKRRRIYAKIKISKISSQVRSHPNFKSLGMGK